MFWAQSATKKERKNQLVNKNIHGKSTTTIAMTVTTTTTMVMMVITRRKDNDGVCKHQNTNQIFTVSVLKQVHRKQIVETRSSSTGCWSQPVSGNLKEVIVLVPWFLTPIITISTLIFNSDLTMPVIPGQNTHKKVWFRKSNSQLKKVR